MRKLKLVVLATITFLTTYAQNGLQISDTIKDEAGYLRYFRLKAETPCKSSAEAKTILQSALSTQENTDFRLVKTKTENKGETSLLYQQLYNNVLQLCETFCLAAILYRLKRSNKSSKLQVSKIG